MTRSGGKPFAQQVFAGDVAVGHVDVADVVDDLAVDLLGHALVEAAVAGLHVEDGDLPALGRDGGQAAIRVAEDRTRVGLDLAEHAIDLAMTWPIVSAAVAPAASRKWSGLRISRSSKKIWFSS